MIKNNNSIKIKKFYSFNTFRTHLSCSLSRNLTSGFTLIELLVVITILGVLAVIVIVAINPTERQARARDTGRISSVNQIGRAVVAYYTSRGEFPSDDGGWADDLLNVGELSTFPSGIDYVAYSVEECSTYVQPGVNPTYCYDYDSSNEAIVFATAESQSYTSKCSSPNVAYFVFSTADARGGTICSDGDPAPWTPGTQNYVD